MTQARQRNRRPAAETPPPEPEPDHPDDEPDTPPPAEPEPEAEPGSPEAQMRKIDNARRKYRRDLEGIVGDLGAAAECELCNGLGFVDPDGTPRVHPEKELCRKCAGLGQLVTGSRAPGHETLPCPDCSGAGYTSKIHPPPENVTQLPVPAAATPAQQVHGWFDPVTQTFHPYAETAAP